MIVASQFRLWKLGELLFPWGAVSFCFYRNWFGRKGKVDCIKLAKIIINIWIDSGTLLVVGYFQNGQLLDRIYLAIGKLSIKIHLAPGTHERCFSSVQARWVHYFLRVSGTSVSRDLGWELALSFIKRDNLTRPTTSITKIIRIT